MKIACIGAGPAWHYLAISMKLRDPQHDVRVFERNARGVTFGWGVVFSDQMVLIDPSWTLRAAAAQDYRGIFVPAPYLNGMAQLARTMQREAEAAAALLKR